MRPKPGTATPRKAVRKGSFDRRAIAACGLLACLLALIHFRIDVLAIVSGPTLLSASSTARESNNDLLNGSILVMPHTGNICRQRTIDNATWHIRDGGMVDCADAMTKNADTWRSRMSEIRTNAVRDSFVNK